MMNHNGIKTRRGKFSLLLTACSLTVPFAVVAAKDLTWTGSTGTNSNAWDNAVTDNWAERGTTTQATFADGDNVWIESGTYTEPSLRMTRHNRPGDVVFNIAAGETFSFGWNAKDRGLDVDTKSFTKRGKGTLLLRSDLSGSQRDAAGDATYGNAMTCGVDIVEGEIACKNRNSHNYLGPRTIPYWVYIRDGASLSFLQGNQTGAADSDQCGIKIQLEEGGRLNIVTNAIDNATKQQNSLLCVNTLKLAGGDIAVGDMVYQEQAEHIGLTSILKIFNTLWFSGKTPHAFGYEDGTYPGCKHYSSAGTFKSRYVSLESGTPVEFRVDDITASADVDAYVRIGALTWGWNGNGQDGNGNNISKADIVKTGAGTLSFSGGSLKGDVTVKEGTFVAASQGVFPANGLYLQTITVSTNATLRMNIRNMVSGDALAGTANVNIVIDHGTLEFAPASGDNGMVSVNDLILDDASLSIHNYGHGNNYGIFYFKNSVTFKGTRPLVMWPDEEMGYTDRQSVLVGRSDGARTVFDVADMTGDGRTDVVMGYHIWNGTTGGASANVISTAGFVKTGSGTFSVASTANRVSGAVTVSNGTMRVDGSLTTPSSVEVVAGAYLGGTGTVANVNLEVGAGFAAPAGQDTPLTVNGNLSLPATGVVNISNLGGYESGELPAAKLVTATGTITGMENLADWTVKINGVTARNWKLKLHGGVLYARPEKGFVISYR